MYTIKCFWAGQLVSSFKAGNDEDIAEKLQDLKESIKAKDIMHTSCGHTFVLGELCVDVMLGKELFATHNLKA